MKPKTGIAINRDKYWSITLFYFGKAKQFYLSKPHNLVAEIEYSKEATEHNINIGTLTQHIKFYIGTTK